jgi:GDP-D-mannose dehydratase
MKLLYDIRPDEIYNLAAQSHVKVSFEVPEYTADTVACGPLRILEAIRHTGLHCRFYRASSSEMFGSTPPPQRESRCPIGNGNVTSENQGARAIGCQTSPRQFSSCITSYIRTR